MHIGGQIKYSCCKLSNLKFELKACRAAIVKLFGVLLKVIRTFSEDTMLGEAIVLEFKFLIISVS